MEGAQSSWEAGILGGARGGVGGDPMTDGGLTSLDGAPTGRPLPGKWVVGGSTYGV